MSQEYQIASEKKQVFKRKKRGEEDEDCQKPPIGTNLKRVPNGQGQNNLSNTINDNCNKINNKLYWIITTKENKCPWVHIDINDWLNNKSMRGKSQSALRNISNSTSTRHEGKRKSALEHHSNDCFRQHLLMNAEMEEKQNTRLDSNYLPPKNILITVVVLPKFLDTPLSRSGT